MGLLDKVKEEAISIPEGATDGKCECPKCHTTGSFYITREAGELKFICFRVTCGFKGVISSNVGEYEPAKPATKKLFNGELDMLNYFEIEYLRRKFKLPESSLKLVRWSNDDYRVYFPQYDINGKVHGYIARYYSELCTFEQRGAKAIWKPIKSQEAGLLFPSMDVLTAIKRQKQVALVEDYPSALRINAQLNIPCCCLGGTNLYDKVISTLMALGVDRVLIILDADAVTKAVKMKRLLSFCIPDTIAVPLTGKDPKDMSIPELGQILGQYVRD